MFIISVAIQVLKAVITVHHNNSFNEHIFTIETKEDARISPSEIKVIQPKANKIRLSFLCILLLQSHNKVMHQSIPSANTPPPPSKPPGTFLRWSKPCPGAKFSCKSTAPGAKNTYLRGVF